MLSFNKISLQYGDKLLFDKISAHIEPRDRIGLVGSNGMGKTTLFRILIGEITPDQGSIKKSKHIDLGYLPQEILVTSECTLYDEVEHSLSTIKDTQHRLHQAQSKLQSLPLDSVQYGKTLEVLGELEDKLQALEAHRQKSKIEKLLLGLGFQLSDMDRNTNEFSEGKQMRIALAKLLLQQLPLLLLDEPTNHLDLQSLRWLESYLKTYSGALIIISHDQAFLDSLCDKIFHLSLGRLNIHHGNYTHFLQEVEKQKKLTKKAYNNQQRFIAQQQHFIDHFRYKSTKARQVQSRIKALGKIQRIEIEEEETQLQFIFPTPHRCSQVMLELHQLSKSYGGKTILNKVDLKIEKKDRVAVVGVNGAGKSTLIRILAGLESITSGERMVATNTDIAYFAQHQADTLDPTKNVLETVQEALTTDSTIKPRTILGSFLFSGDDVFKPVSILSGGEKNRLALAKMLVKPFNLLILDEPTNHLDIRSKKTLQHALNNYPGSLIIISHDRAFLNPLVAKVIEVKEQKLNIFLGNITDYLWTLEQQTPYHNTCKEEKHTHTNRTTTKRQQLKLLQRNASFLEKNITTLEEKIHNLTTQLAAPDFFKVEAHAKKVLIEHKKLQQQLAKLLQEWETIVDKIEQLQKNK